MSLIDQQTAAVKSISIAEFRARIDDDEDREIIEGKEEEEEPEKPVLKGAALAI